MRIYILITSIVFLLINNLFAQDDLLSELDDNSKEEVFYNPAFKAMKIGNLQSTKVAEKNDFFLYVSHRFGSVKDGMDTFFGLDNANTKIQLIYGLINGLQFGISRESLRKTYAGSVKMRIAKQTQNFPFNISAYATVNLNAELKEERYPLLKYKDRFSYTSQILISRRISKNLSIQFAPSFVRQNLVLEAFQKHEQLALGVGGRLKLSKRMSVNADYVHNLDRADKSIYNNPLTIGIDIETGGHVFQLLFSNAQSTNEPGFISNAEGNWTEGNVFFGFNVVRVF